MNKKTLKLLPQIAIIIIISFQSEMLIAFLWVVLHEASHYVAANIMKLKKEEAGFHPLGSYLMLKDLDYLSPNKDIILSGIGPLCNLIFAVFCLAIYRSYPSEFLWLSFISNIALMIFNLLPAFPLDGSRILRAQLSKKMLYKRAYKITIYSSFIVSALLLSGFIFLLFFKKINLTLGLSAVYIFFWTLREKKRIMYIIMGDVVKKRRRFIKQRYIENKSLSLSNTLTLAVVLGLIDKNKYNIFLILDDDMKVLGELYEEDIIYGAKEYGNITLEELMKKAEYESRLIRK